jgi:hypothetical protein
MVELLLDVFQFLFWYFSFILILQYSFLFSLYSGSFFNFLVDAMLLSLFSFHRNLRVCVFFCIKFTLLFFNNFVLSVSTILQLYNRIISLNNSTKHTSFLSLNYKFYVNIEEEHSFYDTQSSHFEIVYFYLILLKNKNHQMKKGYHFYLYKTTYNTLNNKMVYLNVFFWFTKFTFQQLTFIFKINYLWWYSNLIALYKFL